MHMANEQSSIHEIRHHTAPWRTYRRGHEKHGWIALSNWTEKDGRRVGHTHLRWGIHLIPWIRDWIIGHELDHLLCADFSTHEDHHDHPSQPDPHFCGRSHSWRGLLARGRHIQTPLNTARMLRHRGVTHELAEPGSNLNPLEEST